MTPLPDIQVNALVTGEVVVAFVARGALTEGDEIDLIGSGAIDPDRLQPRFRDRFRETSPPGFSAVVVSVDPAAVLDPAAGQGCHIYKEPGEGDLVILRVYGRGGAVLEDDSFDRLRSIAEGALRG